MTQPQQYNKSQFPASFHRLLKWISLSGISEGESGNDGLQEVRLVGEKAGYDFIPADFAECVEQAC